MINGKKIGLGILSYRAHDTLHRTLQSYDSPGFTSLFDDRLIYFNDFQERDRQIAATFSYRVAGGPNVGFTAQEQLAHHLDADYLLLTQNDCPLVEAPEEVARQLQTAVELLEAGKIDLMRFRHRWLVGEGFSDVIKYARFYNIASVDENFIPGEHGLGKDGFPFSLARTFKKYLRPIKARKMIGRSVYVEKYPEELFPRYIKRDNNVWIVDSECIDYTEQSFLISKTLFLDVLCKYIRENPKKRTLHGFQVPEYILNCPWWRKNHFKIGVCRGIFTHNRFDDSFRENHHAYNRTV